MSQAPCLLYVVTEDWFFLSHFLGMAKAAQREGFDVAVATRLGKHRGKIVATDIRPHAVDIDRAGFSPSTLVATIRALRRIMREERPHIVHCIALRAILTGGIAAWLEAVPTLVLAPTGLGYLWSRKGWAARSFRFVLRFIIGTLLNRRNTTFLFENPDDAAALGLDPNDDTKVTLVKGAGVDGADFQPLPLPVGDELRLAVVARMIETKRIADAVEAVRLAQQAGAHVTLDIYGAPDPSNPASLQDGTLLAWSRLPGIAWHGPTTDVASVWAKSHAAILLSTGEGLPRSLVEALASARAIITTDAPGNRIVVADGINGFLVPVGAPDQAAFAIKRLAGDKNLQVSMGQASRARFEEGFTSAQVTSAVAILYRSLKP